MCGTRWLMQLSREIRSSELDFMRRKRRDGKNYQRSDDNSERSFGLLFGAVFGVIGLFPLLDGSLTLAFVRWWAIAVAIAFVLLATLRPSFLVTPNRLWRGLGIALGRVMNPLIMGLMFFVILTPVALVKRLFWGTSFPLKPDASKESYWTTVDSPEDGTDMKNQF